MPEKISQEWLLAHGFYRVHINPTYKGGFFRYFQSDYQDAPTEICVTFYNDVGVRVLLTTDMTWIELPYVQTVDDLQALHVMLRGKRIEDAPNEDSSR